MILSADIRQHPSANFFPSTFFHDLPLRPSSPTTSSSPFTFSSTASPASSYDTFPSATASPSSSFTDFPRSPAEHYMPKATSQPSQYHQHQLQQDQQQQQQAHLSPGTVVTSGADNGSFYGASWTQPNDMAQLVPQQQQQQQQQHQSQPSRQQRGRFPNQPFHLRNNSGSTVVSAGPSSPFPSSPHIQTQGYPRIVDSESQSLVSADGLEHYDHFPTINTFHKSIPTSAANRAFTESLFSPEFENFSPNAAQDAAQYLIYMRQAMARQQEHSGQHGRQSEEAGGALDAAGNNMPLLRTESTDGEPKLQLARASVPHLDRSVSEIYQDELFNPNIVGAVPSASSAGGDRRTLVADAVKEANSRHIAGSQSPASSGTTVATTSRERSPYPPSQIRSQLGDEARGFPYQGSPFGSAAKLRAMQKVEEEARAKRQNSIDDTPNTISPNDSLLHNPEFEEDSSVSARMFFAPLPQPQPQQAERKQQIKGESSPVYSAASSTSSNNAQQRRVAAAPAVVPQQYPFIANQRRQFSAVSQNMTSADDVSLDFPAHLPSMESTKSETGGFTAKSQPSSQPRQHRRSGSRNEATSPRSQVSEDEEDNNEAESDEENSEEGSNTTAATPIQRPAHTTADSGTYTCTYHGCTLRFETPAKLQKHKREAHRQTSPNSAAAVAAAAGSNTPILNSQAGPHRCDRINPSTGKPCNSIFSRPYDLTRHEDTIHNSRKQKVRCQLCAEEKTFSRNDALTRHMRVVHPEVDFPGKTKKRNG